MSIRRSESAEDKFRKSAIESNEINMSEYMIGQFKLITEKLDDHGEKIVKMYNWMINDPETGNHGIIRTVQSNSKRIDNLEVDKLIRKREVRLITVIGGAIYTLINLALKYI